MFNPIHKSRLLLLTAFLALAAFAFTGSGCRLLQRDKQSIERRKKASNDKKANAEYDKALKQHYKHQSKDAKKMMKHTKKQAAVFNKPRKRGMFSKTKCN